MSSPAQTRDDGRALNARLIGTNKLLAMAAVLRMRRDRVLSTVHGHSMGSTLPAGTQVEISFAERSAIVPGQVVAFAHDGHLIVHRVIRRGRLPHSKAYLITRGDAALLCDLPVQGSSVLGTVSRLASAGGWILCPPPDFSRLRGVARALLAAPLVCLLEIHPRLAIWLWAGVLRLRAIWLRSRRAARAFRLGLTSFV